MNKLLACLASLLLLSSAACAAVPPADRLWTYADLRLLQPAADPAAPSSDLLAVYTRDAGSDVQIRLDFLDLPPVPDRDLYVALDTRPGGLDSALLSPQPFAPSAADRTPTAFAWDTLLVLPAGGLPQAFTAGQAGASQTIRPRLVRDPGLDTLTISLNRTYLPEPFRLQVFVTLPCKPQAGPCDPRPVDATPAVSTGDPPPAGRAALLLEFWNVLPAATPAQALRRWDGAHTGPNGGRHGLNLVLQPAAQFGIPLALLDLKTPASLAALDDLGQTGRIRRLSDLGLLILPDVVFAEPADVSLAFSRRASAGFNLPASPFIYSATAGLQPGYLAQFASLPDPTRLAADGRTRLIPLPPADAVQATDEGPSLDVRQALLAAALSGDRSRLVVLGGNLPASTWGNADAAAATFAWIAAHPWIQPLRADDLLTMPVGSRADLPRQVARSSPTTLHFPGHPNAIDDSLWQTLFMLTAPTGDAQLDSLHSNYMDQVTILMKASAWADAPGAQAGCGSDLGLRTGECVLSNPRYYAVFNSAGARLTHLFYLDQAGAHQLIAPSYQFAVGLSDPSEWKLGAGEAADPSAIPGAFADDGQPWRPYQAAVSPGRLAFSTADGALVKTYRLTENGLEATYTTNAPITTRIPLAVDPQAFYFGPTNYLGSPGTGSWTWGPANGTRVEVRSEAALSGEGFTSSHDLLSKPEDPNRDYPSGHYFPFPLAVVILSSDGGFSVQITAK